MCVCVCVCVCVCGAEIYVDNFIVQQKKDLMLLLYFTLQGHLARYLAFKYGLNVVTMEAVGCHITTATKLDRW